ncbi:MAG: glycosyltransferase family 4 protein [Halobacteriovoraceae bacterium]|nr:glycosyltransferase family 4 protein [Halobacteriovoraceae bacterium]
MKKLKILFLTTSFPRKSGDVAGVFVQKLAEELGQNVDLEILLPSDSEIQRKQSENYTLTPIRYCPLESSETFFYRAGGIPEALKKSPFQVIKLALFMVSAGIVTFIKARNKDIIHINWLTNGLLGILPKWVWRKKLCLTLRGSDIQRMRNNKVDHTIAKIILKFTDALVSVNKDNIQIIKEEFPWFKGKILYIPNGVSFADDQKESQIPVQGTFRVLFVGNLIRSKGILKIFEVFERLRSQYDSLVFYFIGEGELKPLVLEYQEKYPANIVCIGNLSNKEVLAFMKKCSLLVLPSESEGRPNVVLEAMANKLPVLASDLPGIAEVITHKMSGLLFSPEDTVKFEELLRFSIENPTEIKQYAENARAFIDAQQLTWEMCAKKNLNLYGELVGF